MTTQSPRNEASSQGEVSANKPSISNVSQESQTSETKASTSTGSRKLAPTIEARWMPLMEECLELARQAAAAGEVPIGAVVVDRNGKVLARARNRRQELCDPSAHAEVLALRQAGELLGSSHLDGCTLVVTLEPCTMCAGAIQLARVERVVFGAFEPKTGAVGSLRDVLRDSRANHTVEVIAPVAEEACGKLLQDFFTARR